MRKRYLESNIIADLRQKMVLLSGPRQVGKTTLVRQIGKTFFKSFTYLTWDYQPDRKKIINFQLPADTSLIIFDELHKYKLWKNYLKGIYDKHHENFQMLVTGSARLDIYRKGGDSLMGRYHHYLLYPFSLAELLEVKNKIVPLEKLNFFNSTFAHKTLELLLRFGPFPEPFLKQNMTHWRRWQMEKNERLVKEEIRDLRLIGDLSTLQILVDILPTKVSSLLSINSLREDLQVAHKTLVNYLNILEFFYFHCRIFPFAKSNIRSLRKMSKLYLWDWSVVANEGAKFENCMAMHLLKLTHYLQNAQGYKIQLHYLKDAEGREVDFLVAVDGQPWFAVETKYDKEKISPHLLYFARKLKIPYLYQVIREPEVDYWQGKVRVISAEKFLMGLI